MELTVAADPPSRDATVQRCLKLLGKTIVTDHGVAPCGTANRFACAVADRGYAERQIRRAPIDIGRTQVEVLNLWMHERIRRTECKATKTRPRVVRCISPVGSGIVNQGVTSALPELEGCSMCGWESDAARRMSRKNRSRPSASPRVRAQDLEGDVAIMAQVARTIDSGHTALTDGCANAVAVGERKGEARRTMKEIISIQMRAPPRRRETFALTRPHSDTPRS